MTSLCLRVDFGTITCSLDSQEPFDSFLIYIKTKSGLMGPSWISQWPLEIQSLKCVQCNYCLKNVCLDTKIMFILYLEAAK